MKIFISNNAASLREALSKFESTATVEAEYGDDVVQGSVLTLAHHGRLAHRPCPCSIGNLTNLGIEAVGISHVDLDTLGGIMAIMGIKPAAANWQRIFWQVAAKLDVSGIHKLPGIPIEKAFKALVLDALNAFWAFSETTEGRIYPQRDGSALEIDLGQHFGVIKNILECKRVSAEQKALVASGRAWADAKEELDRDSLVHDLGNVLFRSSDKFVNHLYRDASAVVAFNKKTKAITVSFAGPIRGLSCREFVQEMWGPGAGGHDGIAGSPRGMEMSFEEATLAAYLFDKHIIQAQK